MVTLIPMPTTQRAPLSSVSTPPSFLSPTITSLGHFNPTESTPARRRPSTIASPETSDSPVAAASPRHQPKDSSTELERGACQERPRRPRPAVCSSARQTRP